MTVSEGDSPESVRPARRRRGIGRFIRDVLIIVVVAVLVSAGIKAFLIRSFYIPSGSMMNTLQVGDRILVNELVPKVVAVQRGDVIVFADPGGWLEGEPAVAAPTGLAAIIDRALSVIGLSSQDSNGHLIKRVIGLPGDHVVCCNSLGQLTVNGIPLKEPYLDLPITTTRASEKDFDVTVPKNSLWVMGDNRNNSKDSRFNRDTPSKGFVPMSDVVGRAFVITWPAADWGGLDNYPEVFSGTGKGN